MTPAFRGLELLGSANKADISVLPETLPLTPLDPDRTAPDPCSTQGDLVPLAADSGHNVTG